MEFYLNINNELAVISDQFEEHNRGCVRSSIFWNKRYFMIF